MKQSIRIILLIGLLLIDKQLLVAKSVDYFDYSNPLEDTNKSSDSDTVDSIPSTIAINSNNENDKGFEIEKTNEIDEPEETDKKVIFDHTIPVEVTATHKPEPSTNDVVKEPNKHEETHTDIIDGVDRTTLSSLSPLPTIQIKLVAATQSIEEISSESSLDSTTTTNDQSSSTSINVLINVANVVNQTIETQNVEVEEAYSSYKKFNFMINIHVNQLLNSLMLLITIITTIYLLQKWLCICVCNRKCSRNSGSNSSRDESSTSTLSHVQTKIFNFFFKYLFMLLLLSLIVSTSRTIVYFLHDFNSQNQTLTTSATSASSNNKLLFETSIFKLDNWILRTIIESTNYPFFIYFIYLLIQMFYKMKNNIRILQSNRKCSLKRVLLLNHSILISAFVLLCIPILIVFVIIYLQYKFKTSEEQSLFINYIFKLIGILYLFILLILFVIINIFYKKSGSNKEHATRSLESTQTNAYGFDISKIIQIDEFDDEDFMYINKNYKRLVRKYLIIYVICIGLLVFYSIIDIINVVFYFKSSQKQQQNDTITNKKSQNSYELIEFCFNLVQTIVLFLVYLLINCSIIIFQIYISRYLTDVDDDTTDANRNKIFNNNNLIGSGGGGGGGNIKPGLKYNDDLFNEKAHLTRGRSSTQQGNNEATLLATEFKYTKADASTNNNVDGNNQIDHNNNNNNSNSNLYKPGRIYYGQQDYDLDEQLPKLIINENKDTNSYTDSTYSSNRRLNNNYFENFMGNSNMGNNNEEFLPLTNTMSSNNNGFLTFKRPNNNIKKPIVNDDVVQYASTDIIQQNTNKT